MFYKPLFQLIFFFEIFFRCSFLKPVNLLRQALDYSNFSSKRIIIIRGKGHITERGPRSSSPPTTTSTTTLRVRAVWWWWWSAPRYVNKLSTSSGRGRASVSGQQSRELLKWWPATTAAHNIWTIFECECARCGIGCEPSPCPKSAFTFSFFLIHNLSFSWIQRHECNASQTLY